MLTTVLTISLAIAFAAVGVPKLVGTTAATRQVTRFGYSAGMARLVGAAETAAAAALAWGLTDTRGIIAGSLMVIVLMVGVLYSHLFRGKDPFSKWLPAVAMLTMAATLLGLTL